MSEIIREYRILGRLGKGGMATVYLAEHTHLKTKVALKVLNEEYSDNERIRERFLNEARLLGNLRHPNIVHLNEFFQENGRFVLIMEFVDGRSLDEMIGKEIGPVPVNKAIPLFTQVLEGISYAHEKGILHRDIKPANILVSKTGEVKIADLGIAKVAGSKGMTKTGTKIGTVYYMSPEQVKGEEADFRSDIYSLGMTLYETLSGRLPFGEESETSEFEVMGKIVKGELPDPREFYPHIPDWAVKAVKQATAARPEERFQNCCYFNDYLKENSRCGTESSYWKNQVTSLGTRELKQTPAFSTTTQPQNRSTSDSSCPECGSVVTPEMEFCGDCGTTLNEVCPKCHNVTRKGKRFCSSCGQDIPAYIEEMERRETEKKLRKEQQRREAERRKQEAERRRKKEAEEQRKRREEEEERLRKEEEERRREAEKRKAWWRRNWWKVFAPVAALIMIISIVGYKNSDSYKFDQAVKLYQTGAWEEAAQEFTLLVPFENSAVYRDSCWYQLASYSLEQGNYPEAVEYINMISVLNTETYEFGHSYDPFTAEYMPGPLESMTFVRIPAGLCIMGSPSSESGRDSDEERHRVTVGSFELMTTEVTQGMWEEVMGSSPASGRGVGDNYPVYNVSWNDCQEFIDRLNDMDPSHTYRLPSESEWEYACRAGTSTRFYWGDSDSESTMDRYCWYSGNSNSSTHPVASKEPNAWGLYDMSGNVWEWCEDKYNSDYDDCPTDGRAYTGSGSYRVTRGGSWNLYARLCRSAFRYGLSPGIRYNYLGFRVARSV